MQRLREAPKAKIGELSSRSVHLDQPAYITVDADKNPLFSDERLTRAEFQRITQVTAGPHLASRSVGDR